MKLLRWLVFAARVPLESREDDRRRRREESRTGGRVETRKKGQAESAGGPTPKGLTLYRFSKRFFPPSVFSVTFFSALRLPFLISVYLFRCLFVSFGTKNMVHAAIGRIRFHVYTQDGSDWPGLKPSQITP